MGMAMMGMAMMRVANMPVCMLVWGFGRIAGCRRSVSLLLHPEIFYAFETRCAASVATLLRSLTLRYLDFVDAPGLHCQHQTSFLIARVCAELLLREPVRRKR
jgi:hypothetical protein